MRKFENLKMKKSKVIKLIATSLLIQVFSFVSNAQQNTLPLNRFFTQEIDRVLLQDSQQVHTASKPYVESKINLARVTGYAKDSVKVYEWYDDKLLRSHLFSIKGDDFSIAIDPLMDFGWAIDLADTSAYADTVNLWSNTRGLQVLGNLGKKFSFQTGFYENQTFLPLYQKAFADSTKVIPGMGRWKVHKYVGYDYAMAFGLISYSPKEWVNIQFGHGKNFIGHGYRSILLSDAAFNYPYFKSTLYFLKGKVQYTSLYAPLTTLDRLPLGETPESLYRRKGYSYNYLSFLPNKRIEIGLFEGIIWKRYDASEGTLPQPWGAYVPVIGLNTALNGMAGVNNVIVGANLKIQTNKHSYVYSQVALDDTKNAGLGWQVGAKYFNLLLPNLDLQVEYNNVGDNFYASHYANQSYTHTNQPLGHPTGPASTELLGILNYRWHRIIAQIKYNHISQGLGPEASWRNDPEVILQTFAPWPTQAVQQWDIQAGLYLNPKTNLQVLFGWTDRLEKTKFNWQPDGTQHTSMLYLSLRTNLINRYSDF
jgi:hypothetical protein